MTKTLSKNDACCEAVEVHRTQCDTTYAPRFDIWEGEDELILYGDLPGVSAENLDVRFENRVLTIHGQVPPRCQGVEMLYSEYGIGDFYRTFSVAETIDGSKISAELNNGVLTVHLPKTEEVKPRRIEVKG